MTEIRTEFVYPPIPIRDFDWAATLEGYGGGESEPVGRGATEAEAIADLRAMLAETEPDPLREAFHAGYRAGQEDQTSIDWGRSAIGADARFRRWRAA